jgi:hypothetical protein
MPIPAGRSQIQKNYNLLKINKFDIVMVLMPHLQELLPDIGAELA